MQCIIISLREIPSILEKETEIAIFWKSFSETSSEKKMYQPVWQTLSWAKMLIESKQVFDAIFFGIYEDSQLVGYGIGEIRSVGL